MKNCTIHQGHFPEMLAFKLSIVFLPVLIAFQLSAQTTPQMQIYHVADEQFLQYIQDSLLFGGGELSQPQMYGRTDGRDIFLNGYDIGIQKGIILSNGWVMSTINIDGGDNKNGHQTNPERDSLGPYIDLEPLRDADMDWMSGYLQQLGKSDTAVDPTTIMFKFKPYYNTIKFDYVFASEEYQFDPGPGGPGGGGGDPNDIDLTGEPMSDFMAIFCKRTPGEQTPSMIVSIIGTDWGPGQPNKAPVCVKFVNHESLDYAYVSNLDRNVIFDGLTVPLTIDVTSMQVPVNPCQTYWIKAGVADFPNGISMQGYNLNHLANSALFLEQFSLMSGYGLEWTVDYALETEFQVDTAVVEGGCSKVIITVKPNVMPLDTFYVRLRIDGAIAGEYTVEPPLLQDSLMVIPDSTMEVNYTITALDDGILEGTGGTGKEKWNIRYQMDPCDVPMADTTGFGTNNQGYTGLIRVNVLDYYPYNNAKKTYGPIPSSIFRCGNNVTVTVTDVSQGGIPPYYYVWSHPAVPQLGTGENFTTPISDSPDYVYCTITDRCSGKPGYIAGSDTVVIYSQLDVQASSDFQLCQNGQSLIKVQHTNVGHNFTTVWYFQGNPVGYDSLYLVTWAEYGSYAPNTLTFTCEVTDYCGNISSDQVNATFFPVVEITGVPLICIGDDIELICSGAQSYQWYKNSISPPNIIPGATSQTLIYHPTTPGFHTICVQILNDCGEQADTCFTFEVSQLTCAVQLNNGNDFSVCPNVPFTLREINAYDGWNWSWYDQGVLHSAMGQTISVSLHDAGSHLVRVIAYNIHGCYDTLNFNVTVFPYAQLEATTQWSSVCEDYPTDLNCYPNGPVTGVSYHWTANPPDPTLTSPWSQNPTVAPSQTTTYQCKVLDDNGCYDSTTVTVNVRPRIAGNIIAMPGSACTDKPVQLNFSEIVSPLPGASYYWVLDGGNPPTSGQEMPTVLWTTPGQKNIQLTITEPGCEESFELNYTVHPDPQALFTASDNTGCQPVEASFFNNSQNLQTPTYLWDFGDGTTSAETNPTHLYEFPGNYDITLTVTNQTGCTNTLTINDMVEVYAVPVAEFDAEPQAATIDNPTIRFTEQIDIPYALIQWDFGDGATNTGDASPRHTYGAEGTYYVVMYTETEHGCWDRDTVEIGILADIKIFVPNAFTPDGDGLNDCFSVGGTTGDIIDAFRIIIYSRWGEQILDLPITNPDCVWDGRDASGKFVTPDSYVFRIFGKDFRGAKKVYEGVVTIVK